MKDKADSFRIIVSVGQGARSIIIIIITIIIADVYFKLEYTWLRYLLNLQIRIILKA